MTCIKTDVFIWHSYAEILVADRWLKATPAFDLALCERLGLEPLDFDGQSDSLFHAFDRAGRRHMEYLQGPRVICRCPVRDHPG